MKRKFRAILIAAILGAALFDAMIVAANATYRTWGYGKPAGLTKDVVTGIGQLLAIPAALVSNEGRLINPYLINGLLGAFIFAAVAAFWQLVVKDDTKK